VLIRAAYETTRSRQHTIAPGKNCVLTLQSEVIGY
jgi:hypothetical protein